MRRPAANSEARAAGTYGNVLRFLPPLTIPDALLVEGLDVLAAALHTL